MALDAPPASTAPTVDSSDILANRRPEHVVDRRPDRSNGAHRDERDQRHEQSVFEQVLAIVTPQQAAGTDEDVSHVRRLQNRRFPVVGAAAPPPRVMFELWQPTCSTAD